MNMEEDPPPVYDIIIGILGLIIIFLLILLAFFQYLYM